MEKQNLLIYEQNLPWYLNDNIVLYIVTYNGKTKKKNYIITQDEDE